MFNSPENPPKILEISSNFIITIIAIIGSFTAYLLNNQVGLEKRLTTVEVKSDNQIKTYDDLRHSIEMLDEKIDKLIEKNTR